ncbi:MAG: helix-turn-helix domain-containing protein, partial [Candidatus Izimaplasma sp.]|nr:helix-turn-helix domain-containing protein [Candidatus Izimaplasma bacterium]
MKQATYTLKDIIKITNLSERTIRRYLSDGKLEGYKMGGEWRFTKEQIDDLFSKKDFSKKLVRETSQQVKLFLRGKTETTKNHRVCSIFDFFDVTKKQFFLIREIIMSISSKHTELNMKMIED